VDIGTAAVLAEQRQIAVRLRAAGRYGDAEAALLAAIAAATSALGADDAGVAALRNDLRRLGVRLPPSGAM
jgi:hypothetical protein